MKTLTLMAVTGTLALSLLSSTTFAQGRPSYRDVYPGREGYQQVVHGPAYFSSGDRLPDRYRDGEFRVRDLRGNNLYRPQARNQMWVRVNNQFVLVNLNNGIIRDVIRIEDRSERDWGDAWRQPDREFPDRGPPPRVHDRGDQEARWRERYHTDYSVDSDPFYRQCKNKVDPAGIIIGAVLGGLLGNAAGGRSDQTAGTVAGVFAGGAIGAALTSNLDCDDRAYAYQTYSDGFNSGRTNVTYQWRNPKNNRRGEFMVRDYYDDPDGFRCAEYTQKIFTDGRPGEASGRACRQPDGSWAMID
jgi:surface antigen/Ni/Co efflux regulator RcnB